MRIKERVESLSMNMLGYHELWDILEMFDRKRFFKKILFLSIVVSTLLIIANILLGFKLFGFSLGSDFRVFLFKLSSFMSMFNSSILVLLFISSIIFAFVISSDNKISFPLFIYQSLPIFLLNYFSNKTLSWLYLYGPGAQTYTKGYRDLLQNIYWQYGIIFAIIVVIHLTRWFFEKGILGTTSEKMSIEEASQLIKGMIKTRKLVDIQELSRLTGKSINIWTAKIYQLTGAGIIDGEFDGLNFIPKTKDVEYLADQLAGKTVVVEGVGKFKPCCYNAARVGDTYCMCGLVIPDELKKHVGF